MKKNAFISEDKKQKGEKKYMKIKILFHVST